MAADDEEELKQQAIQYLRNTPPRDPNENIIVACDQGDVYFIWRRFTVAWPALVKHQQRC
jgi:hypothetical protein